MFTGLFPAAPLMTPTTSEILFYQSPDGQVRLDVQLDHDTVWLSQVQMAELFGTTKQNVSLHTRNVFKESELQEKAVVKESLTTAADGKNYRTKYYNLDVIISVGYRVKSARGTSFRQWATQVLRQYLVQGYALNEQRLRQSQRQLADLKRLVQLQAEVAASQELTTDQSQALLRVLGDYARALDVLDQYDHQRLRVAPETVASTEGFELTVAEARQAIDALRAQFGGSELFGREKDQSFESSVRTIYQSFDGHTLYPSVEEKAANLLYFVVKNHSFSDGNKRIAAFLFVYFLDRNHCLYRADGTRRLADNALVALTLLIAESRPEDKDVMATLVVNLINDEN
ncbi:virulence protein RhuM/Fic/DOC family protein [Hymenobacter sp. H14-R3]|uniref:virulence protein RhuM/Fic/DOC family protein n=1 Tax=Hymenobacter sp. H14-R3 TaxID=3046308 RepID=UPI0024BA0148|nr:virulence protein RhuM/Fic/DOC family protein [Hymenobacter sp. H14-R3]MDJ0364787.1 virulence protein RhuM/Fic/DOC family protein [Hymenobacter sp. H14-R3]